METGTYSGLDSLAKKQALSAMDKRDINHIKNTMSGGAAEMAYAKSVTTLPENWDRVKKRLLSKDKSSCAACGAMYRLTVHHRDGNEKNCAPGNLVPLCYSCHDTLPVPPFSESFYCYTIQHHQGASICLKMGYKAGYRDASNCEFFTEKHGCIVELLGVVRDERKKTRYR